MRFTLDSNILIYAFDGLAGSRHDVASKLVLAAMDSDCVLTVQALGEFLNVVSRKRRDLLEDAEHQVSRWQKVFPVIGTRPEHLILAAEFSRRYKLQYFDSLIFWVAKSAGATVLLSEDWQDGFCVEGVTIANPFASTNAEVLATCLAPDPSLQ